MNALPPLSIWRSTPPLTPRPKSILRTAELIALAHGFTLADLIGEGRKRRIAHARQAAFAACSSEGFSSVKIGQRLNRDHSTVLHGIRAHGRRRAERMAAE